jgi:hypothetical protein
VAEAGRPTAHYSPGTETVTFRTSWGRDAVFVQVQGAGRSHASMTHRHADAGHFSIFAGGDYLAVDTGRYNTDEDQHNVVLVDGRCQTSRRGQWGAEWLGGRISHYQQAEHLCYARMDAAQMKGCYWADRHFLFVPFGEDEAYIVTIDNLNRDHGKHSYWWQMHANPDFSFGILGERSAVLNGRSARLDITFAAPGPEDFPQEPHTFLLRQDVKDWQWPYGTESAGQAEHRTSWLLNTCLDRPRLIGELTGLNGHLMAVIVPRRRGQPAIGVSQVPARRLLHVEVDCGAFTDTLIAALDHGCIECDCMKAMTELAWLRRDRRGEVVGAWTLDGTVHSRTP